MVPGEDGTNGFDGPFSAGLCSFYVDVPRLWKENLVQRVSLQVVRGILQEQGMPGDALLFE
jgi:hypothetical protein